jgi:hypothetical protein
MRPRTRITLVLLVILLLAMSSDRVFSEMPARAQRSHNRIQFRIAAIEETALARNVISEAMVEGPPGTDFNISLRGDRFKMSARFLTDLIGEGALKLRAKLDTRRLYGHSERGLPLYEEDAQSHTVEMGFDEQIVLLPFGRNEGDDRLKIEITPAVSEQAIHLPSGKPRPLEINILKQSPGGEIGVQAFKSPHNFQVEARLFEDGVEIARGAADCLVEEPKEIELLSSAKAGAESLANPLAVTITIDRYERSRPSDSAYLKFDIFRFDARERSRRSAVALNWAGVAGIGSDLAYDLSPHYLESSGKRYEIKFNVRLADGEIIY